MKLTDLVDSSTLTAITQVAEETVLERDPMHLPRSQFVDYLRAKAHAVYEEHLVEGRDEAIAEARMQLYHLDAEWRNAARRKANGTD